MNVRNRQAQVGSVRAQRATVAGTVLLLMQLANAAHAGPNEQAKRIYERIAGVPPSATELTTMANIITAGCGAAGCAPNSAGLAVLANAAQTATAARSFYNVTLKNFVIPWTNRDQTVFAPLNDYTATVIGMVRDDVDVQHRAVGRHSLYVQDQRPAGALDGQQRSLRAPRRRRASTCRPTLKPATQSGAYGFPAAATAGLITTRGAALGVLHRRHQPRDVPLHHDQSPVPRHGDRCMDTTRPPDRIRQDVARSPGGDSRVFLNSCIGCHSGMDPMAQAFAYYNFDDDRRTSMVYTAGQVQPKYFINTDNFPYGFVTPDDSWSNRWRAGPNTYARLGSARCRAAAIGAKSLGQELARSDAFAQCQVQKVFQAVCFRAPGSSADMATGHHDQAELQGQRLQAQAGVRRRPRRTAWAVKGAPQ